MTDQGGETLLGTVTKVASSGAFVLDRDPDEWLRGSQFNKVELPAVQVGQMVAVGIDKRRFVRKITIQGAAQPAPVAERVATFAANGAPPYPVQETGKQRSITRLACLNTATAILGGNVQSVDPDEVVDLAARLEAWVNA